MECEGLIDKAILQELESIANRFECDIAEQDYKFKRKLKKLG